MSEEAKKALLDDVHALLDEEDEEEIDEQALLEQYEQQFSAPAPVNESAAEIKKGVFSLDDLRKSRKAEAKGREEAKDETRKGDWVLQSAFVSPGSFDENTLVSFDDVPSIRFDETPLNRASEVRGEEEDERAVECKAEKGEEKETKTSLSPVASLN